MTRLPIELAALTAIALAVACSRSERQTPSGGAPPPGEPGFNAAATSMREALDETVGKGRDGARAICKTAPVEESTWDYEGKALLKLACRAGDAHVTFFFSPDTRIIKVSAQVLSTR